MSLLHRYFSCQTLRTLSVFAAAVVASTTSVPGNQCDAWAAVIVTITIIFIVLPLIQQIYKAARRLLAETSRVKSEGESSFINANIA